MWLKKMFQEMKSYNFDSIGLKMAVNALKRNNV